MPSRDLLIQGPLWTSSETVALDKAEAYGFTVVSMTRDWNVVFENGAEA